MDRLLLVSMPYPAYMNFTTKLRIKFTILICFVVSAIPTVMEMTLWDFAKSQEAFANMMNFESFDEDCISPTYVALPTITLPFTLFFNTFAVLLITALSVILMHKLGKLLKKHRAIGNGNINDFLGPITLQVHEKRIQNRIIKPIVILLAFVFSTIICIVPSQVYFISRRILCPTCVNIPIPGPIITVSLIHCTSLLDAIFYVITEKQIRRFYISCITRLVNRILNL